MTKQDKRRSADQKNNMSHGFFSSLENLSDHLLQYVTKEEDSDNQEDQLH